jgi:hypothetical protein
MFALGALKVRLTQVIRKLTQGNVVDRVIAVVASLYQAHVCVLAIVKVNPRSLVSRGASTRV